MPTVSVIIPALINTPEQLSWLHEAIRSVADNRNDCEIVIGLDRMLERSQRATIQSLYDPLLIVAHETPLRGAGATRNMAIRAARSEYILPLDADDHLTPDAIQLLLEHVSPDRIVYGDIEYFGDKIGLHRLPEYEIGDLLRFTGIMPVTGLHTKDAWRRSGGYDETLTALEDVDYSLRLATIGVYGHHIEQVTLKYRKHAASRQTIAEKDRASIQEIRQYLHEKHKVLYNRGKMNTQPCKTCPNGVLGNGVMQNPAGLGPNQLTVRYTGRMEGNFTVRSWNIRNPDGTPIDYVVQGRGATFQIDARDRGQFETYFKQGLPQYQFIDSPSPTPPPQLNVQASLASLPQLDKMNAADSIKSIEGVSDVPDLAVLLAEEKADKNRKSVIEAIENRMAELSGVTHGSDG